MLCDIKAKKAPKYRTFQSRRFLCAIVSSSQEALAVAKMLTSFWALDGIFKRDV